MLEAEIVMVEIFHKEKEEEIGIVVRIVCHFENFHREVDEVITMAILVRMEDLLVDLLMENVFWIRLLLL